MSLESRKMKEEDSAEEGIALVSFTFVMISAW